jgi:hypothetical protein
MVSEVPPCLTNPQALTVLHLTTADSLTASTSPGDLSAIQICEFCARDPRCRS